jgi:hypothetical protein
MFICLLALRCEGAKSFCQQSVDKRSTGLHIFTAPQMP